ncbi:MAG: selenocysteine-specific translation elongation factor [Syntrophales bacterium]|jgi:selenocysteine-specific elongation factor|nr:selenocysteine-specific translation elongation factor [Syntrophales bacterium]MDY0043067.1 selenocysteine-specific translation elongation factor [Syntrophales bacterium]
MKHIVLGTAGHVDHGKTALVKALTNIDTDRLKEEKERGITIELGFASFKLDEELIVGIVDVPGHEKFVKNMVAGAAGIDLVVMVIAADEGIMPQTREHLDICQLLGIKYGLVALTKTDIVEDEWLDLVTDDIHHFLRGTFLEGAPVIPLSAITGNGLEAFVEALKSIAISAEEKRHSDFLRLPVDRVFTMRGFGTVVTGTLISGTVRTGDTVVILPSDTRTKVRGIQIHNKSSVFADAGYRTAINFQGVEKAAINRGDVVTHQGIFEPSQRMDVYIRHLPHSKKKLKHRAPVRFHTGTTEIMSRVILLDRKELAPGEEAYGQILLETPTIGISQDRFVLRSYSPVTTIGGGEIIDPVAVKIKKFSDPALLEFMKLHRGSKEEKTKIILDRSGIRGISISRLATRTGIRLSDQNHIIEDMLAKKEAILIDKEERRAITASVYKKLIDQMLVIIRDYHKKHPLKKGLAKEELRIRLGNDVHQKLFSRALNDLETGKVLITDKDILYDASHNVNLDGELGSLKEKILDMYKKSGLTPPSTKEVIENFENQNKECRNVLNVLLNEGLLVKLNEDMIFSKQSLESLRADYKEMLLREGKSSPSDFKEMTGLSRKYIIPLMEFYDKNNLTIRVGNQRVLRESEKK